MEKERAEQIAEQFLNMMNPVRWDGEGEMPIGVNTGIMTFTVDDGLEIDISLELDDDDWLYYCELRDGISDDLLDCLHGHGINSKQNLVDSILSITNYVWITPSYN